MPWKTRAKEKEYNASPRGRARREKYRKTVKGKKAMCRYMYSEKGIVARERAMKKIFKKHKKLNRLKKRLDEIWKLKTKEVNHA